MSIKDFTIIAIILASIGLTVDAIYTINKQYRNGKIALQTRNQYIRMVLMAPLLGALLVYQRLHKQPKL
ncbi:hypothetical protein [uncultured Pedobacter sp.]|uniref:hypothetical protein n=1 Tax=uncultured Pedobacter sp. TaxID=246139 RepID=UPI00261C4388|nr:hypothetical protein [uncultured Pedobacter sp.]